MRRAVAILLLFILSVGTVFSPLGNMACTDYVPGMYARCIEEDPEINAADFVFEHLLNLESLLDFLEQDTDEDEPYAPVNITQQVVQASVVVQQVLQPVFVSHDRLSADGAYALYRSPFYDNAFIDDVFHPPIG